MRLHIMIMMIAAFLPAWSHAQTQPPPVANYSMVAPGAQPIAAQPGLRPVSVQAPLPAAIETAPEPLPPPHAQPPAAEPLCLEQLEAMALGANPSIARAAAFVQAARGNWTQVGLKPNPTVGYEGQQLGSGGLAEQHGVFAEQELVRGGKLRLNQEIAAQEVARAEQNLAAQQQRVITDVRIAFYDVLIAQQQENLAAELLALGERSFSVATTLFNAQEAARTDVLQARIEAENARINSVNGRNRRAAAWQSLCAVVGYPKMPLQFLRGDPASGLPCLDFGATLERLVGGSPEIAAQIASVESSRWALERARVERTPNVTLQGMVNVIDNGIGGKPDANLMVGVPLPLWNRNQGGIVQAQGRVAAAERGVEQLELDLQSRLGPVFERYSNSSNQVQRYREVILPAAQESFELTRRSYELGEVGFVNLLTAQRTFAQTRVSYLESLRDVRTSAAQLEGFLLSGSLEIRGE